MGKGYSLDDIFNALFIGFAIGSIMILIIGGIFGFNINLSQETGDSICVNLTGNNSVASTENGKLICEVPSYDHTTNIIIRKAGEQK